MKLGVPIIATAEDVDESGSLCSEILDRLPSETTVHDKMSFGLAADPAIVTAIEATGRGSMILVGLETDVCVSQSALGLLAKGYRVAVLSDAVATPEPGQQVGLERMRSVGVVISSVKGMFFEWMRTAEAVGKFEEHFHEIGLPQGIDLF